MKRKFLWLLTNALFCTGVYFGVVKGVVGVERIVVVFVFLIAITAPFMFTKISQAQIKNLGRSIPKFIDIPYDIIIICVFLWFGWLYTGIAYLIHTIFYHTAIDEALKEDEPSED